MEVQEDRRVRRTHRLLKQGLAELMQEKDFCDITVRDIADRVDLNRATFYMHYANTYELLDRLENEVLADFQHMLDTCRESGGPDGLHSLLLFIAEYIGSNASICKSFFQNRASSDFINKFQRLICEKILRLAQSAGPALSAEPLYCFCSFASYGITGLVKLWLDGGIQTDKHTLVSYAERLIMGAASSVSRI